MVGAEIPDAPIQYVADAGPFRIVALDTIVPQAPQGSLDGGRLQWVREQLDAEPDRPTIVAVHHPPVTTGIGGMDAIGLDRDDARELAAILALAPQVLRVVGGHVHRIATGAAGGVPVWIGPSTHVQLQLELDALVPLSMGSDAPGFSLHGLLDDGSLISHAQPLR